MGAEADMDTDTNDIDTAAAAAKTKQSVNVNNAVPVPGTQNAATTTKPKTKKALSLDLLSIVKQAQSQNGLRFNDYERYRRYCTRRIKRIRRSLELSNDKRKGYRISLFQSRASENTKNKQKTDQVKDKKLGIRFQDVPDKVKNDPKLLTIPLFLCERAWSYAQQLRDELTPEHDRPKVSCHYFSYVLINMAFI
jgi:hypothetical protein